MRSVAAWRRSRVRRSARFVALEDALLGGRFASYAGYRLRLFARRTVIVAAVHVVEFVLLRAVFSSGGLLWAIVMLVGSSLVSSAWWGGLERMREAIRRAHREGRRLDPPRIAGAWLTLSLVLGASVFGVVVGLVALDAARAGSSFGVLHAFAVAVSLGLGLSLITRTYHSAAYATKRVYRPVLTIVAPRLAAFAGVVALWPALGAWGFPLMAALSSCLAAWLTWRYTRRTFGLLGWRPSPRPLRVGRARERGLLTGDFAFGAAAYASIRLDALVVLMVFVFARGEERSSLVSAFFLAGPFVRASWEWAQLFYFDMKRLDLDLLDGVRDWFARRVLVLSLIVAAACWLGASAVTAAVFGGGVAWFALGLLALLVVRSAVSFVQVRAYAEGRYAGLIAGGVALALGSGVAVRAAAGDGGTVAGLAGVFVVVGALASGLVWPARFSRARWLGATSWLARVSRWRGPVAVGSVVFGRELDGPSLGSAMARMRGWLPRGSLASAIGRRRLVWACRAGSAEGAEGFATRWRAQSASAGVRRLAGLVSSADAVGGRGGRGALASAADAGLLGAEARGGGGELGSDALLDRFRGTFSCGVAADVRRRQTVVHDGSAVSGSEGGAESVRGLLGGAVRFAAALAPTGLAGPSEVTAYAPGGRLALIFGVPRSEPLAARRRWRRVLRRATIAETLRGGDGSGWRRGVDKVRMVRWLIAAGVMALIFGAPFLVRVEDRVLAPATIEAVRTAELRAPVAGRADLLLPAGRAEVSAGERVASLRTPQLDGRVAGGQAAFVVSSPIDGLIVDPRPREIDGRQFLQGEVMCTVADVSALELVIGVPESSAGRVSVGQRVSARPIALPGVRAGGSVTGVSAVIRRDEGGPAGEARSGTVLVYAALDEPAPAGLRPGMFAYARVALGERSLAGAAWRRARDFVRTEFWW